MTDARLAGRLQRLRQDHVIEGIVGIIGKVGVGVALNDRQPFGDAIVDAALRYFDAAAVDLARFGEQAQQGAVAAADIEDARARLDHFGDAHKVDARLRGRGDCRHDCALMRRK